jgi:hypothetical protein
MSRTAAWILVLTLFAPRARADSPVPLVRVDTAEAGQGVALSETTSAPPMRRVGLALTAGIPSGAAAELVVRPWRALRVHAGGAYDLASGGLLGGITFAPVRFPIAPVLEIEAGHFFEGDASGLFARVPGLQGGLLQPLRHVGYDFATAELGLELGLPGSFVFTVRVGLAAVQATVHDLAAAVSAGPAVSVADARVRAVIPSARLGFVVFL